MYLAPSLRAFELPSLGRPDSTDDELFLLLLSGAQRREGDAWERAAFGSAERNVSSCVGLGWMSDVCAFVFTLIHIGIRQTHSGFWS